MDDRNGIISAIKTHIKTMTSLENNLHDQIKQLRQENQQLRRQHEQSKAAYDQLLFQMKDMLRHRFGRRSERFIDPENPQASLFDQGQPSDSDPSPDDDDNTSDTVVAIDSRRRKNAKRQFSKDLPRREIIIPVTDADCSCGGEKKVIGYEKHERLNYIPPVYEVIVELREKVVCTQHGEKKIITAPKPLNILPKARITESTLAHIIVSKLEDRQPYYHLEKQLESRASAGLSRQTMARWVINCSVHLQPIINLMKDRIVEYDIGALDATTLQVLNEPNRSPLTKSYVYCFRGGSPGEVVILYDYNAMDHKGFVDRWFAGFQGALHCDADPFFDTLFSRENIIENNCNAHARRKFEPIATAAKGSGLAKHAMRIYQQLYRTERWAKDNNLTPEQRYQLRQDKSKPIMDTFKDWLDELYPLVLPKSPLGKAMAYCLNHWQGLCEFLNDGRLEIDNNLTEQEIKPLVIARKNFLFCNSIAGAKALCLYFSLIRTAKKHNLDPYHYLTTLFQAIPHCKKLEDYEALLPWNLDRQGQATNTAIAA